MTMVKAEKMFMLTRNQEVMGSVDSVVGGGGVILNGNCGKLQEGKRYGEGGYVEGIKNNKMNGNGSDIVTKMAEMV